MKPLLPPACLVKVFEQWPIRFWLYSNCTEEAEAILDSYRTFDDLERRVGDSSEGFR